MLKQLSLVPICVFVVVAAALAVLNITEVVAPLLLIPITHTLFISFVSFAVAYVSARGYMRSGLYSLLLIGNANLAFGLGFLASWLMSAPGGQNVLLTADNTGTLLSSILNVSAAILSWGGVTESKISQRGRTEVTISYGGVSFFMILLAIASFLDITPPFFVQGIGPTPLRDMVLVIALVLFCLSSAGLMKFYFGSKADILWWYSLALALIAVGQLAWLLEKTVGSPLSWTGSIATYLAETYFLVAVLIPTRQASR
ncbi:MAG TPA: hypothetical protein VEG61_05055 [Candidatus Dormibacteraeota bacterium]|nr:hypothetical protein [Candidatus Dormibacteraeota bacterium]